MPASAGMTIFLRRLKPVLGNFDGARNFDHPREGHSKFGGAYFPLAALKYAAS